MIGVIAKPDQAMVVEEFFELFKTPWEFYQAGNAYDVIVATATDLPDIDARLVVLYGSDMKRSDAASNIVVHSRKTGGTLNCADIALPIYRGLATFNVGSNGRSCVTANSGIAGILIRSDSGTVLRLGYDLFEEAKFLLSNGQPIQHAHTPTLDIHIDMLRSWIVSHGLSLLEIPPAPGGHKFFVCLTHDIDFVGITKHKFDHTMWGYLYRSTVGALHNLLRRRISVASLFSVWRAVASLPFVYMGWARDFWSPFEWYLRIEERLPATYFLIPFKRRAGQHVPGRHANRRAAPYDIRDLAHWPTTLMNRGCEISVHGIDAWHSPKKGSEELQAIASISGTHDIGIRVHWLLNDANTLSVLEGAGFAYDSSVGYNDTVGYRAGTSKVFRPLGTKAILELPLHIQDGALFLRQRLDLSEPEAWKRCEPLIEHVRRFGGVLTVLWHDRSHAPERLWGNFYIRLVKALKSEHCFFGTAVHVVDWFRKRREVRFERVEATDGTTHVSLRYGGGQIQPPLTIRFHRPHNEADSAISYRAEACDVLDIAWQGDALSDQDLLVRELEKSSATPVGR